MKRIDENQLFDNVKGSDLAGSGRTFESCRFINSDLSYGDLSGQLFIDCLFENCNLSLARVANTGFQDVRFTGCKISGVNFSHCRDFCLSFSFSRCLLDYSVFYQKKLRNTGFEDCSLVECDFTEADLTKVSFKHCNLAGTVFGHTNLSGADFRTAENFSIDPEDNRMTKARFSAESLGGLLGKYGLIIS